jgi:hypothetical protein
MVFLLKLVRLVASFLSGSIYLLQGVCQPKENCKNQSKSLILKEFYLRNRDFSESIAACPPTGLCAVVGDNQTYFHQMPNAHTERGRFMRGCVERL